MTAGSVILLSGIFLLVLVFICAIARWWIRSGENKAYDERQLIEQGRARAVADTVEVIYFFFLLVYLTYVEFGQKQSLPLSLLIIIGLLLQIMTYHIYCVMTHAALPFGEHHQKSAFWYAVAGAVQIGNYWVHHRNVSLLNPEDGGVGLLNLIAGTAFFFLALIHLIALLRKERE